MPNPTAASDRSQWARRGVAWLQNVYTKARWTQYLVTCCRSRMLSLPNAAELVTAVHRGHLCRLGRYAVSILLARTFCGLGYLRTAFKLPMDFLADFTPLARFEPRDLVWKQQRWWQGQLDSAVEKYCAANAPLRLRQLIDGGSFIRGCYLFSRPGSLRFRTVGGS